MTIGVKLRGTKGKGPILETHIHSFTVASGSHNGPLVLTQPFLNFNPEFHPFLNDTFGTAMNQDITFGGTGKRATIIHAGVNSGSAITGTTDGTPQADKLVDASGGFNAVIGPGAVVHNTTASPDEFAIVTNVDSDTLLSLDSDIMDAGTENYVINDIWPGTAVAGTWDFALGGKFALTSAAGGTSEATFTVDASHIWNMANFVSLTGKVDLGTYNETNNSILIEFGLDGVLVGKAVDLNIAIDTGNFDEQNFIIDKSLFDLTTQNINSMRISVTRSGGSKPVLDFDDFQWENTGAPIIYKATTPDGTRFHITEIRIRIEDDVSAVLTDGSMPNIDPSAILGVSALTNGIIFARVQNGKVLFSVTIKDVGDFLATGSNMINITGNATNTGFTLLVEFPEPIVLEGGSFNNFLAFTVNDSLGALSRFTAAARGALEI